MVDKIKFFKKKMHITFKISLPTTIITFDIFNFKSFQNTD